MRAFTLVAVLLALSAYTTVEAQGPGAYSELTFRASGVRVPTLSRLGPYYDAATGARFEVETPLEFGDLTLELSRVPFHAINPAAQRSFQATTIAADWRVPLVATTRVHGALGVRAGTFVMSFDDSLIDPGLRREEELLLGVSAKMNVGVYRRFGLTVAGTYDHVWLHVPLHLTTFSVGVDYAVSTPHWLRELLQ
jgi:hypothetical protein